MPKCRNCNYDVHPSIGQCPHCGASVDKPIADLEQQVRALLDDGQKIAAVKLYKDQTGVGLAEAKRSRRWRLVLAHRQRQTWRRPGSRVAAAAGSGRQAGSRQVVQGPEGHIIARSQTGGRVAGGKARAGDAAGRVSGRGGGVVLAAVTFGMTIW